MHQVPRGLPDRGRLLRGDPVTPDHPSENGGRHPADSEPVPVFRGPPVRWLDRTLTGVHANLALDEALLVEADQLGGTALVRVWELPTIAVVMGASCRLHEAVNVDACRADGVPIARRCSGGGAVVIGPGALNVSVIVPTDAAPLAVDEAQRWVLGRIADRLRDLGPMVEVLGSGDLALDGRKFSGSAQRRLKRTMLVHASILYALPADRIARYLGAPPKRQPDYRAGRLHDQFLTTVPLDRDAILGACRSAWDAEPSDEDEIRMAYVEKLVATKYADPSWVERF